MVVLNHEVVSLLLEGLEPFRPWKHGVEQEVLLVPDIVKHLIFLSSLCLMYSPSEIYLILGTTEDTSNHLNSGTTNIWA